jgi:hypothetical protein
MCGKVCLSTFDIISILKAKSSKSTIPEFYAETLKYWSEMRECSIPKDNYLWYNKTITKNTIPFFYKAFQQIEINYISDLIDPDGTIIPFRKLENKGLSRTEWFKWYTLTSIIKKNYKNKKHEYYQYTGKEVFFKINNIQLSKITSNQIYKAIMV